MIPDIRPSAFPMAAYFVVPVDFGGDGPLLESGNHIQQCKYYRCDTGSGTYQGLGDSQLPALESGGELEYVCLQQLPVSTMVDPPLQPGQATRGVTLFSATAKTLSSPDGCNGLPDVFLASIVNTQGRPTVVVPVGARERRGVILVFEVDDGNGNVAGLRGSFDPEIKGSTTG